MKITYDDEAEAIYIALQELHPGITKRTVDVDGRLPVRFEGATINLDLDKDDKPVGFEIIFDYLSDEAREILKKHFDIKKNVWNNTRQASNTWNRR